MAQIIRGLEALEAECAACSKVSPLITRTIEVCADCIRGSPEATTHGLQRIHAKTRHEFDLPVHHRTLRVESAAPFASMSASLPMVSTVSAGHGLTLQGSWETWAARLRRASSNSPP